MCYFYVYRNVSAYNSISRYILTTRWMNLIYHILPESLFQNILKYHIVTHFNCWLIIMLSIYIILDILTLGASDLIPVNKMFYLYSSFHNRYGTFNFDPILNMTVHLCRPCLFVVKCRYMKISRSVFLWFFPWLLVC